MQTPSVYEFLRKWSQSNNLELTQNLEVKKDHMREKIQIK